MFRNSSQQIISVPNVKFISFFTKQYVCKKTHVGVPGFEPGTSSSRTKRANRAALHPADVMKNNLYKKLFHLVSLTKLKYF